MSEDLSNEVEEILVDDSREHVLTRLTKTKKGVQKVESDHNPIITKLKLSWNTKMKNNRKEFLT